MRNVNKIRRLSDGCHGSARRPMPADEQAPTCRVPWLSSRVPWLRLLQPRFCVTTPPSIVVANTATTAPDHTIRNPAKKSAIRNGFTLTELLVVIAIIVLVAAVALPTVIGLFSAGADAQAHNVIAAQLAYARALAIQNDTYAGVHVQMADATTSLAEEETCYAAVVIYNQSAGTFSLATGCKPQRIPGSIAFGQLRDDVDVNNDGNTSGTGEAGFVSGGSYRNLADASLPGFTTFTIVFSPSGQVVTRVAGGNVVFAPGGLFTPAATAVWDLNTAKAAASSTGVAAITMFDYRELNLRSAAERIIYLNESGQFLPINVYTGQLFPRE